VQIAGWYLWLTANKDKKRSGRKSSSSIVVELSFWDKDGSNQLNIRRYDFQVIDNNGEYLVSLLSHQDGLGLVLADAPNQSETLLLGVMVLLLPGVGTRAGVNDDVSLQVNFLIEHSRQTCATGVGPAARKVVSSLDGEVAGARRGPA
jgi:hypothetical protein